MLKVCSDVIGGRDQKAKGKRQTKLGWRMTTLA
jgi:hypothetical protein